MNFKKLLQNLKACEDATEWAGEKQIEEIVLTCPRGDWLLWLASKLELDERLVVLASARCAYAVRHLMVDERSQNAVDTAEQFGLGLATKEELDAVAYPAFPAASAASAAAYAHAAAYAATSATSAAFSAYAAAYAHAAREDTELKTANICREILGDLIIKTVNEMLKEEAK